MPKSANQKLRLLFEREILLRETDEENPITTKQLISRWRIAAFRLKEKLFIVILRLFPYMVWI